MQGEITVTKMADEDLSKESSVTKLSDADNCKGGHIEKICHHKLLLGLS